ncbi:GumC family protein [Acuticoccus kandeliae]|uniref:GumC family protein n=1 Tax=Acuticoccus kandeliae TaxID=2073160 RepID=UPI000D3E62E7|nr:Wzz/FepE/Etk N-terminal domain-containing protein [Acuticoccus kandeliae]
MNTIPDDFRAEPIGRPRAARGPETNHSEFVDIGLLLQAARRQAWLVIASIIVFSGLAIAYAMSLQPLFTSYATILLDEERAELVNLISELPSAMMRDATVQSEVEVLKSQALAERVVERLNLEERPYALSVAPPPIAVAMGWVKGTISGAIDLFRGARPEGEGGGDGGPAIALKTQLAGTLRQRLDVQRIGRSYVLQLSYTAPDPALAAEIADAYTGAYLNFQLESNAAAANSAVRFMRDRVATLRQMSLDASRDLETFRHEHGLVSVGERLLSEQQLSEILSQLVIAQADASRANALAEQAEAAIAAGPNAAIAELTGNSTDTVGADLRTRYLGALGQQRRVEAQYGADHPEAKRLAAEVANIEAMITEELQRRTQQARAAAKAQETRVASLRSGLDDAMNLSGGDSATAYRLRQLEQTEQSYKELYQSALTRLETVVPQQSIPITPARVITEPDMPKGASSPSKAKYLALGFLLGAVVGGGAGTLRELARDKLDNEGDVDRILGVPTVGTLPRGRRGAARQRLSLALPKDPRIQRLLRALKINLDRATNARGACSVAFLSARPTDGAGGLALGFARMLAEYGVPVLLVDADTGAKSIVNQLKLSQDESLVSLASQGGTIAIDTLRPVADLPLYVLRFAPEDNPYAGTVFSSSPHMRNGLMAFTGEVDYVVFNCPPASEGPDIDAIAPYADAAILVVRKGRSSASKNRAIVANPIWQDRLTGVVLS